ncbi:MAG: DNA repair protein RecN [Bacteroidota bacterium]
MLTRLHISNYALIDDLTLDPQNGMTVITGETGAGKSILLGALSLILGSRADSNALAASGKKCVIEADFNLKGYDLKPFFVAHDLDYEELTTVRREVSTEGKSRAFVNDTPVNLSNLKEMGSRLIDIHSQHETLTINNSEFQMHVVDSLAGCTDQVKKMASIFINHKSAILELDELKKEKAKLESESDFNRYLLEELESANPKIGELEALESEQQMLEGAEGLQTAVASALNSLQSEPVDIQGTILKIVNNLSPLSSVYPFVKEWINRLKSVQIELKDLASDMEHGVESINLDSEKLSRINDRTDLLNRLFRKHRVDSIDQLIEIKNRLTDSFIGNENLEQRIKSLESKVNSLHEEISLMAVDIRKMRTKSIAGIKKNVGDLLKDVGLNNAQFDIDLQPLPKGVFRENGGDRIEFLFSANKGASLKPLDKVASGGELSRLMLCIKSLLAEKAGLPTLIFDEIDTGVSGETAHKIGSVIRQMAQGRQVMVITHLPQMAAHGSDHFFVSKKVVSGKTQTQVVRLSKEQRIDELARMLSGELLTEAARANARELLASGS